ncbi:pyruvate kinase-like protein [Nemania abortiva]|nr:pyruvate kinase-like protein [Nemania abortiva]
MKNERHRHNILRILQQKAYPIETLKSNSPPTAQATSSPSCDPLPYYPILATTLELILDFTMGSYSSPESDLVPLPPKVTVLSLRTGKVRPLGGVKITSAINKQPRRDRVRLTKLGFVGDERQFPPHLSLDNAIHQYDPGHYALWEKELPDRKDKFTAGAFGENISTPHLSETNVCVGDRFRLGDAVVEVTMTRQPCFKLNHRFEHKKMSSMVQSTGRTGWYYRVLEEGFVEEGSEMELIERINPAYLRLWRLVFPFLARSQL